MPLLRKALRDLRWGIAGYGVGLGLLAAMYMALYPAFADVMSEMEIPEGMSAFFGDVSDLGSPRAFIQLEFFSFWMPMLLAIYAIAGGTAQLAGDEGGGTLEMMLAQPVSRRRVFLERAAALAVGAVLICALAAGGLVLASPLVDLEGDLAVWELAAAPFGLLPFVFALTALALFIGTLAATRAQAVSLMTAATVAFYLMDVLADLVSSLAPLRNWSIFYYGDTKKVLISGPEPAHLAVLLVLTAVLIALALRAFQAREIGVGRWQLRALLGRSA